MVPVLSLGSLSQSTQRPGTGDLNPRDPESNPSKSAVWANPAYLPATNNLKCLSVYKSGGTALQKVTKVEPADFTRII